MSVTIITTAHPDFHIQVVRDLFLSYNAFLDISLDFQGFEHELAALPGKYHPDNGGQLYVAYWQGQAVGCAAFYQFQPMVCELKRLYVLPKAQGLGIGKALIQLAIADATAVGYRQMLLDSAERLTTAKALYLSLGFQLVAPYNQNIYPDAYHMALDLTAAAVT